MWWINLTVRSSKAYGKTCQAHDFAFTVDFQTCGLLVVLHIEKEEIAADPTSFFTNVPAMITCGTKRLNDTVIIVMANSLDLTGYLEIFSFPRGLALFKGNNQVASDFGDDSDKTALVVVSTMRILHVHVVFDVLLPSVISKSLCCRE